MSWQQSGNNGKVLVMKKLLGIVVLGLLLSVNAFADDIRDFEIEGISIGDSLLDYYSEDYIYRNIQNNYFTHIKDKTFVAASIRDASFDVYEVLQFIFKRNDKQFIIFGMTGGIFYRTNIDECYSKIDEISEDISKNIKFNGEDKFKDLEMSAKTGKYSGHTFFLNKGIISVHCYDWYEKTERDNNWVDNLRINIKTDEFENFLQKG